MVTPFANSKIKIINRGEGWMLMDHFEFSLCFTASHLLVNFTSSSLQNVLKMKKNIKIEMKTKNASPPLTC